MSPKTARAQAESMPAMTNPGHEPIRDSYQSPKRSVSPLGRLLPSCVFHGRFIWRLLKAGRLARRGQYSDSHWARDARGVLCDLESVGVQFIVEGVQHFRELPDPCLFVANHMSSLETVVLPGLILPYRPVTFVVKSSLLRLPVFGPVIRSRHPVAVERKDPRADFEVLIREGMKRLEAGVSLVIFPQHTRSPSFQVTHFNKIGVKLARRANVPIVPLALRTDAWATGPCRCDFGRIRPERPVFFTFGPPLGIEGRGHEEHRHICEFISRHEQVWTTGDRRQGSHGPE